MARKNKEVTSRLAARYLDDNILLSSTHAWTYLRLPLVSYEFLSYSAREGIADQITNALAALITNNQETIQAHLRIAHRPFSTADWSDSLNARAKKSNTAPVWESYLSNMASRVNRIGFEEKEVYLGVCLGDRRNSQNTKVGLGSSALGEALAPLKDITKALENFAKYDDMVVSDLEIGYWSDKAQDIHRTLSQSYLHAVPATAEEIAWLISRPLWPEMHQPSVGNPNISKWGPGEIVSLAEGIATDLHRMVEIEQIDLLGNSVKGYGITLSVSRFPDTLFFPEQEPWIHFAASNSFNVDFSTRFEIVPALKVQKDVGKKLAIAMDQAQHIAESGNSVPLKIREQLQVATNLEYTIDKDRMPWAYSRHRIMVSGSTPEEAASRANTIREQYRELGIDVVWSSGEQFALLCESMPGDIVRSKSYYQRQELSILSAAMPTASSLVGDIEVGNPPWRGPYLGYTRNRVKTPVFFSPHVAMARNFPPGVSITGAPGGGKSFLAFSLAYQMAVQGVWTIYIDPKADAKPMGQLKGLGSPKVFDLREGNEGMLDPFSLGETPAEASLQALETLRLLLGGTSMSEEREDALLTAVNAVAATPAPSLSKIVEYLLSSDAFASKNLGAVLDTLRKLPFAKLCFASSTGAKLRPEDGLTVITLLGLDLPSVDADPENFSYENRLAVAVMYLLTRFSRKLMLGMDKDHPKAICIDEAWAITSTPQGKKLIPEIARMGRSHNTALVLVSQNAGDLMEQAVTNSLSTKFAFRSTIPDEIEDVLTLFGLESDQGYQSAVRDLNNGECLMQDADGRVAMIKVDDWDQVLFDTFNTNPETRGKTSGRSEQQRGA